MQNMNNFQRTKVQASLLSICLTFCLCQPGISYKVAADKKACIPKCT